MTNREHPYTLAQPCPLQGTLPPSRHPRRLLSGIQDGGSGASILRTPLPVGLDPSLRGDDKQEIPLSQTYPLQNTLPPSRHPRRLLSGIQAGSSGASIPPIPCWWAWIHSCAGMTRRKYPFAQPSLFQGTCHLPVIPESGYRGSRMVVP